jgi:ATP-dependent DNA ligase
MPWTKRKENGRRPPGVPKPSIPARSDRIPSGSAWIHEIKHDGYRLLIRKDGDSVRIITRGGYDWSERYPLIRITAHLVGAESFTLDGECVVCAGNGVADFALLRCASLLDPKMKASALLIQRKYRKPRTQRNANK